MGQGNHDVEVKLKFGADTMEASKAVQALNQGTRELSKAEEDYQNKLKNRIKGIEENARMQKDLIKLGYIEDPAIANNYQNKLKNRIKSIQENARMQKDLIEGGYIEDPAIAKAEAEWLKKKAKLIAGVYTLSKVLEGTAKAIGTLSDHTLSTTAKIAKMYDDILQEIPVVSSVNSAAKAITTEVFFGKSKRSLSRAQEESDVNMAGFSINKDYENSFDSLRANTSAERSRVRDMARIARRDIATTTAGLAFGGMVIAGAAQDPRLVDAANKKDAALIDLNEADTRRRSVLNQWNSKSADIKRLEEERANEADKQNSAPRGSKNNIYTDEEKRVRLLELDNKLIAERAKLEELTNQKKNTSLALAQKIYNLQKSENDLAKAKVDILREDEAKAKGREESFGLMGAGDKLGLLYAVRQIKQGGIESVPEDVRNLVANNPLTGEWAKNLAAKSADRDPVYGMLAKEMGFERASDITAKRLEAEAKVKIKFNVDSEELAKSLEKSIDAHMPEMMKLINDIAEDRIKAFNNRARPVP